MGKEVIEALVDGGNAKPAPPLGPTLAQAKLNIGEVIQKINEKTKEFAGMKVPVKIIYDPDTHKLLDIKVGTPPVSSLIKKELGIEKAALSEEDKKAGKTIVANMTMDQVIKVTKMKIDDLLAKDFKSAVKQVVGSIVSMQGITIEGKSPKEILKEIDEGKWDEKFEKESKSVSQ